MKYPRSKLSTFLDERPKVFCPSCFCVCISTSQDKKKEQRRHPAKRRPLCFSLRSRRLEVVDTRKNGRARRRHPCVSPSRAPVLSLARYFQAPATQANGFLAER